ncbi:MAG: hypothetical protein LBK47_03370 [Prevotellaceae bacterium]|jgi:hypothetical protein|nr:hypothetical protein [Prevotellaceae bacterium]
MKKIRIMFVALALLAGTVVSLASCSEDDSKKDPSGSSTDILGSLTVAFDSLDVQTAQQLVQGKWKIYRQCGGVVGCMNVKEVFTHEYVGADKLCITNIDETDEKTITEWRKSNAGYEIIVSSIDSDSTYAFTLRMLVNRDTLHFGTRLNKMPVLTWAAVKDKQ